MEIKIKERCEVISEYNGEPVKVYEHYDITVNGETKTITPEILYGDNAYNFANSEKKEYIYNSMEELEEANWETSLERSLFDAIFDILAKYRVLNEERKEINKYETLEEAEETIKSLKKMDKDMGYSRERNYIIEEIKGDEE